MTNKELIDNYFSALIGEQKKKSQTLGLALGQILLAFLVSWIAKYTTGYPFWKSMLVIFGAACFFKIQMIEWWLFKKKNL